MPAAELITEMLADSPSAFWEGQDASGNPADSSGNSNNITTVSGTITYHATGPLSDFALEFDAGEYCTRAVILSGTDNITLECFFRATALPASQERILWNGSLGSNGYGLYIANSGGNAKLQGLLGGVTGLSNSDLTLVIGNWYLVVLRRQSGTWKYFINGSADTVSLGSSAPGTPTTESGFGSKDNVSGQRIAYAALYPTALSDSRLLTHYTAAFPSPTSIGWLSDAAIEVQPKEKGATRTGPLTTLPKQGPFYAKAFTTPQTHLKEARFYTLPPTPPPPKPPSVVQAKAHEQFYKFFRETRYTEITSLGLLGTSNLVLAGASVRYKLREDISPRYSMSTNRRFRMVPGNPVSVVDLQFVSRFKET